MPASIEIFRPGTHRDIGGRELTFSESDVAAMASAYDPDAHEAPICIGHPRHDMPAYGWIKSLRFADGALVADPENVDADFARLVKEGKFRKVSAAFYEPDSPDNPKPGVYYLRHVGFLGAQPPAVKGLKQAQFAGGDTGYVAFADFDTLALIGVFRSLRDFIIEKFGLDQADQVIPSWALDSMQNAAASAPGDAGAPTPAFAETKPEDPALAEERRKLAADRAAHAAEVAAFAEAKAKERRAEDGRFIDGLVQAGRLLPAQKPGMAAFLEAVNGGGVVAFGEGQTRIEQSARDWFRAFVESLPKQVAFGEAAPARELQETPIGNIVVPKGYSVNADRVELHQRALAYQEAHQGVTYVQAVKAVEGE